MKMLNIKDGVKTGRTITPADTEKTYVFDVAGDLNSNPNTFFVSVKITFDSDPHKLAVCYLNSGDILDLNTANGRITKIESYFNCSFRVIE